MLRHYQKSDAAAHSLLRLVASDPRGLTHVTEVVTLAA